MDLIPSRLLMANFRAFKPNTEVYFLLFCCSLIFNIGTIVLVNDCFLKCLYLDDPWIKYINKFDILLHQHLTHKLNKLSASL